MFSAKLRCLGASTDCVNFEIVLDVKMNVDVDMMIFVFSCFLSVKSEIK